MAHALELRSPHEPVADKAVALPGGPASAPETTAPAALVTGLVSIIKRRGHERLSRQIHVWWERLELEYRFRRVRDGYPTARVWLFDALARPCLPDLRQGKSLDDDARLVEHFGRLKREVQPVFRRFPSSAAKRNRDLAPIIARVLDHRIRPEALPVTDQLAAFCHEVLRKDPSQVSRARRRLANAAAKPLRLAIEVLDVVISMTAAEGVSVIRSAQAVRVELIRMLTELGNTTQP